jgi:hypothetical protein
MVPTSNFRKHSMFKKLCYFFLLLTIPCTLQPQSTSQPNAASTVASTTTSVGNSITQGGTQIAQSFGYCPDSYTYSLQVWNDLAVSLKADVQKVLSIQNTKFDTSDVTSQTIAPYSSSSSQSFSNINLCHGIVNLLPVSTNPFTAPFFTYSFDVAQKDANTYFFHTFQTSETDGPQGEFMGPGLYGGPYISTTQFDGIFFNKSPYEAQLSFKKNGQTYTVSLESLSFNLLSSDSWQPDSIRSSTETRSFAIIVNNQKFSLPVNAQGLGDTFYDPSSTTTQQIPLTYTYEIYQNQNALNVVTQGFNMGNHNQLGLLDLSQTTTPTADDLAAIRDINPIDCSAWYQSPEQYKSLQATPQQNQTSSTQEIPYPLPGTLWATYQTSDWKINQQLTVGDVTNFTVIRPQTQENGNLYIFSLNTTDATKAAQFLANVTKNKNLAQILTTNIAVDPSSTLESDFVASRLQQTCQAGPTVPTTCNALINDPTSGVTGALLLTDTFVPYGGGTKTPRYYQISPAILLVDDSFASIVTSNLDPTLFNSKTDAMTADFSNNIVAWLATFNQNATKVDASQINLTNVIEYASQIQSLVPELTSYLQQKGLAKQLFTNPTASPGQRTFSAQGLKALYLILYGPLSLNSPPLIVQPGLNAYLGLKAGQLPKGWPTS